MEVVNKLMTHKQYLISERQHVIPKDYSPKNHHIIKIVVIKMYLNCVLLYYVII